MFYSVGDQLVNFGVLRTCSRSLSERCLSRTVSDFCQLCKNAVINRYPCICVYVQFSFMLTLHFCFSLGVVWSKCYPLFFNLGSFFQETFVFGFLGLVWGPFTLTGFQLHYDLLFQC